jgi:hypothetical protein
LTPLTKFECNLCSCKRHALLNQWHATCHWLRVITYWLGIFLDVGLCMYTALVTQKLSSLFFYCKCSLPFFGCNLSLPLLGLWKIKSNVGTLFNWKLRHFVVWQKWYTSVQCYIWNAREFERNMWQVVYAIARLCASCRMFYQMTWLKIVYVTECCLHTILFMCANRRCRGSNMILFNPFV